MFGVEELILLSALFAIAILYSSVGHGGGSGYLAVLSLSTLAGSDPIWLKQHSWTLNLVVAGIAFLHFHRQGFHQRSLTVPFLVVSVPMAFIGGYLRVDGVLYDTLLSMVLIWAAWRLFDSQSVDFEVASGVPEFREVVPWGASIGLASGAIGIGGGIFLSPVMLLNRWATPKVVAASAAAFIWVNSAAGLIGSAASGQFVLDLDFISIAVPVVLVGGFLGSTYGAGVAHQSTVRRLLVAVLLIAAGKRVLGLLGI